MAGVTAQLDVRLTARLTGAPIADGVPLYSAEINRSVIFAPGVATINNADLLYRATRTLAASANEDLDLAGVLTSALGSVIAAAEVVAIVIEAATANTNDLRYGPAASGGALLGFADATDRRLVSPGDFDVLTSRRGWTVTATSADKLNIANAAAGTPITYTITVIGRTVAA